MSKLLEIFGRAITVDTADLIWHWLNALHKHDETDNLKAHEFNEIVELLGNMDLEKAQEKFEQLGGYEIRHTAEKVLTGLGFLGWQWLLPLLIVPLAGLVAFIATRRAALTTLKETS